MDLQAQKLIALVVISILLAGGLLLVYGLRMVDEKLTEEEKAGDKLGLSLFFILGFIFTVLYLYVWSNL
nr:MAG TPA: hypothetical protein [Herelleviridae sp.]